VLLYRIKHLLLSVASIDADERAHREAMELVTEVTLSMAWRGDLLKWEVVVNS